jgi:NAD-dependent dihydropyrimidine dehydrogenase PreA subunit/thioredoxin reductase
LALYGHGVTAFEKHVRPGGMMNQGIPEFRLPRSVVEAEIGQVRALGVDVRCGVAVGPDVSLQELLAEYDAVVMAAGTLRPNLLDLPGSSLQGIRHGLDFLLEVNETGGAKVGRRVAVIGGGFTAMDCARTAARLQRRAGLRDAEVRVWYRRSVSEMLITPGEIEELRHEGIPMEFMVSPMAYVGEAQRLSGLRLVRTRLGEPGADGRRRPLPIPGSEFEVQADTVLLATGQFPDTSWIDAGLRERLVGGDGWLRQGDSPRSVVPGLFVAGDFGGGASSLIQAIGHARSTAREVDALLMGPRRLGDRVRIADVRTTGRIREMDAVPQQPMPALALVDRDLRAEVETGFTQSTAVEESLRCYRCHLKFEIDPDRCIGCDWCLKVRPRPQCILRVRRVTADDQGRIVGWEEAARTQDTSFIWINQEDCIRCGACVAACPVDAISLQRVDRETGP